MTKALLLATALLLSGCVVAPYGGHGYGYGGYGHGYGYGGYGYGSGNGGHGYGGGYGH
jgi:hypothetical protein